VTGLPALLRPLVARRGTPRSLKGQYRVGHVTPNQLGEGAVIPSEPRPRPSSHDPLEYRINVEIASRVGPFGVDHEDDHVLVRT